MQALVKQAFLDADLHQLYRFSSANSINIARLIPQSFYYFDAYRQLPSKDLPFVFSVPSGNFGNLTAGLIARRMGLPVQHFIASTNINDIVPVYLSSGDYFPKAYVPTLSNVMDVGNPSSFHRVLDPGFFHQLKHEGFIFTPREVFSSLDCNFTARAMATPFTFSSYYWEKVFSSSLNTKNQSRCRVVDLVGVTALPDIP